MSNFDKLKGLSGLKQDIDRHDGKLSKRVSDIKKVISNPDQWNVNIASRDRVEALELRIAKLEKQINKMINEGPK